MIRILSGVCFKMSESYREQLNKRRRQDGESLQDYLKRLKEITITCSPEELRTVVQENPTAPIFPHGDYPGLCDGKICIDVFGALLNTVGFSAREIRIVYECFKNHGIVTFKDLQKLTASNLVEEILLLDDADERIYDGQLSQIQLNKLANGLKEAGLIQTEAATAAAATSGLNCKADEGLDPEPKQVELAKQLVRKSLKPLQQKTIWNQKNLEFKVYFKPFARVQRGRVIPMPGVEVIMDLVKNPKEARFIVAMTEVAETLGLEYKEIKTNVEECPADAGWDEDENYKQFKQLKICFERRGEALSP